MAWANINLNDISTQLETIPAGKYVFEILSGAKEDEQGRLQMTVAIASDGEFKGRKVFASYPDPESVGARSGKRQDWSAVAFKRLTQAVGVECDAAEDKAVYLNRIAGHKFTSSIKLSDVTEDYPTPRANLNLLNVTPAA